MAIRNRTGSPLLLGGLLLCTLLGSPTSQGDDFSLIEVPIEVALSSVRDQLERAVPVQRYQQRWRQYGGIGVRYRIWRGPLALRAVRDRLHLGADVGYWVSARKKLLGPLKVSGSCGLREPPRAARLHVSTRLYWGPDWRLHTETRVHRNRFANPCRLTRARIDVTPVIDRYLNRKMNQVLREQVDLLVPRLSDMRKQAASAWNTIQMPLRLDKDAWLVLQPMAMHAAPFRTNADSLTTEIGITIQPRIVFGSRPETSLTPLPDIDTTFIATRPGLDFTVGVDLPLQSLRSRLVEIATPRLARLGLGTLDLEDLRLRADQGDLILQMPSFSLRARPVLDKDRQHLVLDSVSLTSGTTASVAATGASGDGQTGLTDLLNETLSWSYEDRVRSIRDLLNAALNRSIHPHVQLRGRIDVVEPVALRIEADRVRAKVRVKGEMRLLVN